MPIFSRLDPFFERELRFLTDVHEKVVGEQEGDLPALTGPGSELIYAALWFMGNSSPGTMISGGE